MFSRIFAVGAMVLVAAQSASASSSLICVSSRSQLSTLTVALRMDSEKVSIMGDLFYKKSVMLDLDGEFENLSNGVIQFEGQALNASVHPAERTLFSVRGHFRLLSKDRGQLKLDLGDHARSVMSTTLLDCTPEGRLRY